MNQSNIKSCIRTSQRGFNLVELMIAITIGFVIVGAIGYLFIGSRQSFRTTDAISRIQENARYALQTMAHDVRIAGNPGCGAPLPTTTAPIMGWDNGTAVPAAEGIPAAGTGSRVGGDVIKITGGAATDCGYPAGVLTGPPPGFPLNPPPDTITFYIGQNPSGGRSLYRIVNAGTPVELADNVWDMQVLYLVNGSNSYVWAGSGPPNWVQVTSARINLLMVSADNVLSGPQTYQYFANTANVRSNMTPAAASVDRLRLHQVFTTTVGLRNRLL